MKQPSIFSRQKRSANVQESDKGRILYSEFNFLCILSFEEERSDNLSGQQSAGFQRYCNLHFFSLQDIVLVICKFSEILLASQDALEVMLVTQCTEWHTSLVAFVFGLGLSKNRKCGLGCSLYSTWSRKELLTGLMKNPSLTFNMSMIIMVIWCMAEPGAPWSGGVFADCYLWPLSRFGRNTTSPKYETGSDRKE